MRDRRCAEDDATPTNGAAERPAEPAAPGPRPDAGTSRREFLAYSGAGVVAATLPLADAEAAPRATAPGVRGPGPVEIVLRVNGARRRVVVSPSTTLAHALRDELGLTGTKIGCDRGACSACTVLIDGAPFSACMTFALDVGEREVTTIEGLARGRELHPVQEAFVAKDAMQCGFCTPGMVMSCVALLSRNAHPTLDDVKAATSGNYCRCGSYPNVFEAALSAGEAISSKEG